MTAGTLTSRALTQAYLDRIAAIDDSGPQLNAVIDINPAALKEAEARDVERKAGKVTRTAARHPRADQGQHRRRGDDQLCRLARASSTTVPRPTPSSFAAFATLASSFSAATNLSEWANFRSTRSTSGWSSRGGQTKNPHVLDRNPCGSSSGSAVAVAASLASVAIGTETNGSIICPASVNGVVGLKPTVGLVSRTGIIPIAPSQDTAGPIGRTVADVAALLSGMAFLDDRDLATRDADRPGRARLHRIPEPQRAEGPANWRAGAVADAAGR